MDELKKEEQLISTRGTSIKDWAEEDRPREKMLLKGKNALSNAELIAILLGSGSTDQSAVELAKSILAQYNNNLEELGKATLKELQKFKGIGEAKAISIAAALELGRRRQAAAPLLQPQIMTSQDAYHILAAALSDLPHEEFWVLVLSRANRVERKFQLSAGGVAGTVVDIKKLFQKVLEYDRVASIILAHNHPSGNLSPSQEDLNVTRKIQEAGRVLEILVFDHLILAGNRYFSFADEGLL